VTYNVDRFALLPPRFRPEQLRLLTEDFWNYVYPGYSQLPPLFKGVMPFLVATLYHHEPYMRANLLPEHPIFKSKLFNVELKASLSSNILVGTGHCNITGMVASGIPPHLVLAEELELVKQYLADIVESISTQPEATAVRMRKLLKEEFEVSGITAVTARDLDTAINRLLDFVSSGFDKQENANAERETRGQQQVQRLVMQSTPFAEAVGETAAWYSVFDWEDGSIPHFVPKGFRLESQLTVRQLADKWFNGDKGRAIRPYRLLHRTHDISAADRLLHTRARTVMQRFTVEAAKYLEDGEQLIRLPVHRQRLVFETAADLLLRKVYTLQPNNRKHENYYTTLAGILTHCEDLTKTGRRKKTHAVAETVSERVHPVTEVV
jgi:hypothetical protein